MFVARGGRPRLGRRKRWRLDMVQVTDCLEQPKQFSTRITTLSNPSKRQIQRKVFMIVTANSTHCIAKQQCGSTYAPAE